MATERKPVRRRRPQGNVKDESGLTIREADVKRAKAFKWLWYQRILSAALNMVMGEEGIGKGNLVAWIAARVTRGELPGNFEGAPRAVRFIGDEDSWDHIWTPRLHAAGADLKRCVQIVKGTTGVFDVTREADTTALSDHILDNDVALVFFDQLLDNLGVTDSWKDKQVRDALSPLMRIAQATGCAMLMSLHPNKRQGSFRNRVSGTPAFNALSRNSMLVARHPHDESRIVMVRGKGNYSEEPPGFEFRIVETTVKGARGAPVATSHIVDECESELRATDVLDTPGPGRREDSRIGRVRKLITELLVDGEPHSVAEVMAALKAHGIGIESETDKRTISRASVQLKLKKQKHGFGDEGAWTWQMP